MPIAQVIPETLQAALAFALFIVPGFLFRTGYWRSRTRGAVEHDLYAIAEAFVWSIFIIAAVWWWRGHDVFGWAEDGVLREHERETYELVLLLLLAPLPAGMVAGWLVLWSRGKITHWRPTEGKTRRAELFYLLDKCGVLTLPTVWDQAWDQVGRLGGLTVRVRTITGGEVVGTIEPGAWIGTSPEPRDVYLRRVYRDSGAGDWELVPSTQGVVISGSSIESVEFLWADQGENHGDGDSSTAGSDQ